MRLAEWLANHYVGPGGPERKQTDFARLMNVPRSTVHRWLNGERTPNADSIVLIEQHTGGAVKAADFSTAKGLAPYAGA